MAQGDSSRQAILPILATLFAVIAAARIVSTYRVFSETSDEPTHLASGMEWLDRGTYTFDVMNPPLARVAVALGPFLAGLRLPDQNTPGDWGNEILYARGRYTRHLALARLGVLPFFLLAVFGVYAWTRRLAGSGAAVVSVLIFTTLPPILAHAGLATTDMPFTALLVGALFALTLWFERPTLLRSLALGAAAGLALLTKFSAVLFLLACGLAILGGRWLVYKYRAPTADVERRPRLAAAAVATLAACLLIWAGYRFAFSLQPLSPASSRPHLTIDRYLGSSGILHRIAYFADERVPVPAPGFFKGLRAAADLDVRGTNAYLLGKVRPGGWWYFFLVALAFKSPIPFLILGGLGVVVSILGVRKHPDWRPLAPPVAAAAILLVTMPARINLGLRHILPMYALLAIAAVLGATALWNAPRRRALGRAVVAILVTWQVVSSARIHPDYLAYFNELAGRHPERILVDSDLDWGQDVLRLSDALRARRVDELSIACFCSADLSQHLPRYTPLVPYKPTTGWVAISLFDLEEGGWYQSKPVPPDAYSWLEAYQPVALVGRSIRLYYIPTGAGAPPDQPRSTR